MYRFVNVIINNESRSVDREFLYKIPDRFLTKIKRGMWVKVPFGNMKRDVAAFVLSLSEEISVNFTIKEISDILPNIPSLSENEMKLIEFMREKYLCSYIDCLKTMIPPGAMNGVKSKYEDVLYIGLEPEGRFGREPYIKIYDLVKKNNGVYTKTQLSKNFSLSSSSISTMINHGYLSTQKRISERYNTDEYRKYGEKVLNEEQKNVYDGIINSSADKFLIHGVTGSGKTEIYMALVKYYLKQEKDCIILVPEISLTPQMVERFKGRFGRDVAVFHSRLSAGEKYDEWLRVYSGKVKLAIGARSAVFLPFKNLGLIVIDEEHESSFKSDSSPKYSAREIAEERNRLEGCRVVYGSATPSIDTYYRCKNNEIKLFRIDKRADNASFPDIKITDMRQELMENNYSIFSRELIKDIKECLMKKEQIILFLNRRGFSPFVSCRKCGYVFKCKSCDIAMTYHSKEGRLICHYCGRTEKFTNICPKCKSRYVKQFGVGTEKVENEVKKYFKGIRTLRMDFDTTRRKNSLNDIYQSFKNGEADVLIGTQMVAKGLDFKNVTLVGIIAADLSLNLPDFRAEERTFQLITQVSGRAGRGSKKGRVIIQTYNPENFSIQCASKSDFDTFYKEEIKVRKNMNYPPFSKIMSIIFSSKNERLLIENTRRLGCLLKEEMKKYDGIVLFGPSPCSIAKIKDYNRWQMLVKGNIESKIALEIKNFIYNNLKKYYKDIKINMDINPNSLL